MKLIKNLFFHFLLSFLFVYYFIFSSFLNAKIHHVYNSKELYTCLNMVDNLDVVYLNSGIYFGNFFINKSINIKSKGYVIVSSNGIGSIFTINSKNVTINGLHFYNSGKNMSELDSCLFINGDFIFILNNFFSECGFSIWTNRISYGYIFNNIFIGTNELILPDRGNTIQIFRNDNTMVSDNFIINGRDGIYISNSKEVFLNKNIFTNVRFGIHYMFSNKCSVVSNMISDSLIGIAIMYSKYVDLINNFSFFNINHGLFFRDVLYSRILRNKSIYNVDGILLGDSYFNDIINNDIIKNNIGIKIYSGSDENLVYDNNFICNKMQVQFLDNRKVVWNSKFIGNYWSHYIGWDLNMDNIGDKKFYITNISDWLVSSYPILRVMFASPALNLLQKIENQFPAFRKFSIIDNYPLMRPIIW
jgi:nitrous oxidase accessory protein